MFINKEQGLLFSTKSLGNKLTNVIKNISEGEGL